MPGQLIIRAPVAADAQRIWRALPAIGALERNTAYAYVLLCTHFASTCVVGELGDELAGFALAYRVPAAPDQLFVWQVGVTPAARGRGVGARLLDAVVATPGGRGARWLTATVTAANQGSQALFAGFARRHALTSTTGPGFAAALFPAPHDAEPWIQIGPLPAAPEGVS
ncbi:MAG: diaminobutyrate acetyltransferase [Kofleriaceae bacterium]